MLDVNDLVEGVTKVKILKLPRSVRQAIGDVGVFMRNDNDFKLNLGVDFKSREWFFNPEDLEIVVDPYKEVGVQSSDLIIYKSRWDEIIENLHKPLNLMSDEEVEIVKSVLKNNVPFNVVETPVVIDTVIEKEDQTHLDANYVGVQDNPCFYYRSNILKQWFYWNEDYEWGKCDFDYEDVSDLLPVSFGIGFGESK